MERRAFASALISDFKEAREVRAQLFTFTVQVVQKILHVPSMSSTYSPVRETPAHLI